MGNEYDKLNKEEQDALYQNFLQEPDAYYEKAENEQLKENLRKSYTERFLIMTRLMKMNLMFSNAKITYTKLPSNAKN